MASVATDGIVFDHIHNVEEESKLVERITTSKDLGFENLDISQLVSNAVNRQHILPTSSLNYHPIASTEEADDHRVISKTETITVTETAGEDDDDDDEEEEVIELEFERAADKVHTHTPYCPKCKSQITKVTLRRKIQKKKEKTPSLSPADDEPVDLVGCMSCFSIFKPSSGNKLSPLRIFGWKRKPDYAKPVDEAGEHVAIPINVVRDTTLVLQQRGNNSVRKLDILRCIVYGGLMESIASLTIVSSAAASDVPTLNIVAVGLATLISSFGIFGQNLLELKKEQHGPESSTNKYQQLLGESKDNFLVHATLSTLSFLVFGLVPPIIYGFAFRESDNKNYKIIAVAVATVLCVCLLATAKAYLERHRRLSEYVKTVSYYVAMVVAGSGVGYAVGDLIKSFLEEHHLFDLGPNSSLNAEMMIGKSWMSY